MLIQLNIKQFGIIENATVEFRKGLTVLTGETGAGKSMILAAISQLAGQRTSTSYIRYGEDRAYVEGVFDIPSSKKFSDLLKELDIELDDETVILARYIYSSGKSICKVNRSTVNLTTMKKISAYLLDIHEQHDNQILLQEKNHISLVDSYANTYNSKEYMEYASIYKEYKKLKEKIENLEKEESSVLQKVDFLRYQLTELEKMNLEEDEDIKIQEEIDYLENYEKINTTSKSISKLLNQDNGLLEKLYEVSDHLEKLSRFNPKFEDKTEEVRNMYYILEDLKYDISKFNDNLDFDENVLNDLTLRISQIKNLEKKYSKNLNELIVFKNELANELFELENYEENYEIYKQEFDDLKVMLKKKADEVSELRKSKSKILEKEIQKELKFLYMEKSLIKINFVDKEYGILGKDDIRILISANLGEPLKSLSKVASGGELSRVMLALKIIFSKSIDVVSVIFDEIDTGVSGRVSQRMAEKMYQLAVNSQVICISHLPQTTALADSNLFIHKELKNDRTVSEIVELDVGEKIKEISRMISGTKSTKLSEEHALEMLEIAKNVRKEIVNK
ncbi:MULTISPECIES: DNA repair protein RecN [unclassified Gemella]|uniref:DNA repair protein RecN n=1 Tax=unclassified Gemella TaxID=2624949 RepID=UPI0015CFBF85|nr:MULTISPECIES: DNA repair protein RecN [unclassified Gemella]MBF0709984.1 DNA repair protein RecN [Gemella sp. GL1.1]NYS27328.1 DNA repair protein RecN [Gemella sp. GL1]